MIARRHLGVGDRIRLTVFPDLFNLWCLMDPEALKSYFHDQIPLTRHMGVEVVDASPNHLLLSAPLQGNTNHKSTVFGGSLHSLATLACWGLVKLNLQEAQVSAEIVISGSEIRYLKPVTGKFYAECRSPDEERMERFIAAFRKYGKARIGLDAMVTQDHIVKVAYHGTFAAI